MTKKLNPEEVLKGYEGGMSPEDLALHYEVHPSTIRRYLRESGVKLGKIASPNGLEDTTKYELTELLLKLDVPVQRVIAIIKQLDLNFIIKSRNTPYEALPIIQLKRSDSMKKSTGTKKGTKKGGKKGC